MDTNIIHELAKIALSALAVATTTIVTLYVPRIARRIEQRFDIDIPDPLEVEAVQRAIDAIHFAEEWARSEAKRLGENALSSDKLDQAARYFRDHASEAVIDWVDDRVEEFITVQLGHARARESARLSAAVPIVIDDDKTPLGTENPLMLGAK